MRRCPGLAKPFMEMPAIYRFWEYEPLRLPNSEEATSKAAEEFMAQAPGLTVERHVRNFRWKNPADIVRYSDRLAIAGVPVRRRRGTLA
jgi:hypothetical protein